MVRRRLLLPCLVLLVFAFSAAPALASYGPLWSQPVDGAARLATGTNGATVVWAAAEGGGTSALLAMRYSRAGVPLAASAQTLVSGIADLGGWAATGAGSRDVIVVWKDGGTIAATRVQMDGGASYSAVALCTDAAVAALRGAGATAVPAHVVSDDHGGAFVRLAISPTSDSGDTLLNFLSPLGVAVGADPGLPITGGTVADMTTDGVGHLFVFLAPPGRTGVAVQRFAADLAADWATPVSPYDPLLGPLPSAVPRPIGIVATSSAKTAWREGSKVRLQRFSPTGVRLWPRPASVSMSGEAALAGDGFSGCYLAGPAGRGIVVRHILASGLETPAGGSTLSALGLGTPRVDAVSANRAGDLTVAYSDAGGGASIGSSGAARMTFLGAWVGAAFSPAPERLTGLDGDGAGGAYALGTGAGAALWHVGQSGLAVTLRPRATTIKYGQSVGVAGYLTQDGEPLAGRTVILRKTRGEISLRGAETTTDGDGYYEADLTPGSNFTWSAEAAGAASAGQTIGVMPKLTLTLSHTRADGRWYEHFSGKVTPAHGGARVLVQFRTATGWHTAQAGTVDARSRYRVTWKVPNRTARYTLRVVLPAHADHSEGVSPMATLRVVVKRG